MNLFLRLAWLTLVSRFRPPCPVLGPCRTPFRVAPTDLDVLRHVNNGIYLSILDLARMDLMTRCGLLPQLTARGWYPVVTAETISFRRSLRLFDKFEVDTTVLGWDEKNFFVQQRFLRYGEIVAAAVIRARFLARAGGPIHPAQVLTLLGSIPHPPGIPDWVLRWSQQTSPAGTAATP